MTTFENADDVLTLLVHLGYLSYDFEKEEVYIPNREISKEFYNAVEGAGWTEIANAVHNSKFTPFHWHCMQRDSIIQWSGNIQQEKDLQTLFLFREKSILKSRYY